TYEDNAEYAQDTRQYTIMSYFGGYDLSINNWADETNYKTPATDPSWWFPQTPMVDDILTIQAKYGADTTHNLGNTTYGFNCKGLDDQGTEQFIFDFSLNPHPIFTIWDAGGNNTLDCSGYVGGQSIDLRPGQYSSVDGMVSNVAIAFGT